MRQEKKSPVNQNVKEYLVEQPDELLKYLLEYFSSKKRPLIKAILSGGQVKVNGQQITQFNHSLRKGDQLSINWSKPSKKVKLAQLNIIHEDNQLIVIEKEPGLLSVASAKEKSKTAIQILKDHILARNPKDKVFVVHRLEREMSGILVFAKTAETQAKLQNDWNNYVIDRRYVAIVEGRPNKAQDTLKNYLTINKNNRVFVSKSADGSSMAVTHYKVIKQSRAFSMLELSTESGIKNQIRVQLAHIGHPVTGDKKYTAKKNPLARVALHAGLLEMIHPENGEKLRFELVAPSSFRNLVTQS